MAMLGLLWLQYSPFVHDGPLHPALHVQTLGAVQLPCTQFVQVAGRKKLKFHSQFQEWQLDSNGFRNLVPRSRSLGSIWLRNTLAVCHKTLETTFCSWDTSFYRSPQSLQGSWLHMKAWKHRSKVPLDEKSKGEMNLLNSIISHQTISCTVRAGKSTKARTDARSRTRTPSVAIANR